MFLYKKLFISCKLKMTIYTIRGIFHSKGHVQTLFVSHGNYSSSILSNNFEDKVRYGWKMQKLSNKENQLQSESFTAKLNHKERLYKKKIKHNIESPEGYKITAYSTAYSYNIELMGEFFKNEGYELGLSTSLTDTNSEHLVDPADILRVNSLEKYSGENREIYLFKEGMIVFWNFPKDVQNDVLYSIQKFENKSYENKVIMDEIENLNYSKEDRSAYTIEANRNLLYIPEKTNCNMEKFTISNAMAMSVKLGMLEAFMEEYITMINQHQQICHKSQVTMKRKKVETYMGDLCNLRHSYNLLEFVYLPDFCWEDVKLEQLYYLVLKYMDVRTRTVLLNDRMRSCIDLMALLKDLYDSKRMHILEVTIVVLICVEIVVALVQMAK